MYAYHHTLTPVANLPLVPTIPAENLPPVSTTQVANCHRYQRHRRQLCQRYQRHRRQICHRCRWHKRQIMVTISGCRHLKVNLKAKIYIFVNSSTQRCQTKQLLQFFLLKIFSICHRCQRHWWCPLNCEYLRKFLKKFEAVLMVWGETDSRKKPEVENLVALSL